MATTIQAKTPKVEAGRDVANALRRTNGNRQPRAEVRFAQPAVDLVLVCLSGVLIFYLRFFNHGHIATDIPIAHYVALLGLFALFVELFCQNQGLYETGRSSTLLDQSFSILKAILLATLFLMGFIYLFGDKSTSRLVVGFSGLMSAFALFTWRLGKREVIKRRVSSGKDGRHVLIVGGGDVGQALARHFEENKHLGYVVKGFLAENGQGGSRVIGGIDDLQRLALTHFADEIFITPPFEGGLITRVVVAARRHRLDVNVVPEMFEGLGWRAPIHYIGDFPVVELLREPIPAVGLLAKRVIDVAASAILLVLLAPVMALLAVVVGLDSPGPAIYRSLRVGRKGRKFACYKFRTMVANADEMKDKLRHMNERQGPLFKISNDPRVTRLGRWLRRSSLDELPQLWNVLKGEMSLVGPRPPVPEECAEYCPEHLRRLDVKPGITGLWQVCGRLEPSFERALCLDLEYIEGWSLWLDAKILLRTIPAVLSGSGR